MPLYQPKKWVGETASQFGSPEHGNAIVAGITFSYLFTGIKGLLLVFQSLKKYYKKKKKDQNKSENNDQKLKKHDEEFIVYTETNQDQVSMTTKDGAQRRQINNLKKVQPRDYRDENPTFSKNIGSSKICLDNSIFHQEAIAKQF